MCFVLSLQYTEAVSFHKLYDAKFPLVDTVGSFTDGIDLLVLTVGLCRALLDSRGLGIMTIR